MDNMTHSALSLSGKSGNDRGLTVRATDTGAAVEALKATPPAAVSGMALWGISLEDWVFILTAIYLILQMIFLLRDKLWARKRKDNGSE